MTPPPRNDLPNHDEGQQTKLLLSIYQEVGLLSANITLLMADRTEAAMDRREMNARLSQVDRRLSELSLAEATVRRIEPIVERLESTKNEASGAFRVALVILTAAASVISSGMTLIISKLWK